MPGFSNNMFSLLGMQDGGFAKGKGMASEYEIPVAQPTPSMPVAPPTTQAISPSPQAASMGASFGGYGAQTAQPSMSPAAATEAGRLGTSIAPQTSSSPAAPTMTPATGSGGMVGGTTLTPAPPSATGGGTGGLPTATLGGKFSREEASPVTQSVAPQASATTMSTPAPTTPSPAATAPSEDSGYQKGGRYTREEASVTPTPPEPPAAPVEPTPPQPPAPPAPPTTAMGGEDKYAQQGAQAGTTTGGIEDPAPVTPGAPPDPAGTGEYDQPGAGAGAPTGEYGPPGAGAGAGAPTGSQAAGTTGGMPAAPTGQSLLGATTGGDIASQFGFDPGQYGGYFSPVSEQMRTAATEEGYAGFLGEQRAQLRETGGQQRRGLRASLLQDVMTAQQQGGATGFAGGGAQTQALGLARQGRQLGAEQLASQYGRGMYGVRQQIAGRVTAGEQALASAQRSMYDRALALQRSGATMGAGAGAGAGTGAGYQGAANLTDYGSGVLGMTQADVTASTSPEAQWSAGGGDPNDPTMSVDPTATPLTDWQMGGDYAEAEPEPAYDPLAGLPAYTQLNQPGAGQTPYIQQMPNIPGTGKGKG